MSKKFDMYGYDEIATNVFKKIYPVLAEQIVENTDKTKGKCMDIGSGAGHLGIEISKITDMEIYLYDLSEDSKEVALKKIVEEKIEDRVFPIIGDVKDIPFEDNSIDLIVSRASYKFWGDLEKAFSEIYRVLKPGGKTYIGGGFGSIKLKDEIENTMINRGDKKWVKGKKVKSPEEFKAKFTEIFKAIDIENYKFITDESGEWIIINKK